MRASDIAKAREKARSQHMRDARRAAEKRRTSATKALRADNLNELARIHKSA